MSQISKFKFFTSLYAAATIGIGAAGGVVVDIATSAVDKSNQAGFTAALASHVCNDPSMDVSNRFRKLLACPMAAGAHLALALYAPVTGTPGSAQVYKSMARAYKPAGPN